MKLLLTEIFASYSNCLNLLRDGDDLLCKQCECVVGCVDEENNRGVFVKLFNFRLVEYQPLRMEADDGNSSHHKLINQISEMPNHLKRKAVLDENDGPAFKFYRPNEEKLCVMHASVPPNNFSEPNLSELDILDEFNDISSVSGSLDLDLDDIMPFLLAPMDPYPLDALNNDNAVSLSPLPSNTWPLIVIDDDSDSEVEFVPNPPFFIPNTPPDMDNEYFPTTPLYFPASPSFFPTHDINSDGFPMFATPPPPYPMWPQVNNTENHQVNLTQEEVEAIYRALVILMNALGIYNN